MIEHNELRRLARAGVEAEIARLQDILSELDGAQAPMVPQEKKSVPAPAEAPSRARRVMSPAARKAISKRMKEMWAAKKKAGTR